MDSYDLWFKLKHRKSLPPHISAAQQHLLEWHILGIILTAMNSGRGRHGRLFSRDPRAGASGDMCPDQPRASNTDCNRQAVPYERNFDFQRPGYGYKGMSAQFFALSFGCLTCLSKYNIKQHASPKIDRMLKLSNYETKSYF